MYGIAIATLSASTSPAVVAALALAAPVLGALAASPWAERHRQGGRLWYWACLSGLCAALPTAGPALLAVALG